MLKRFGILNTLIALIGVLSLGYLFYQVWYGLSATRSTAVVQSYESGTRGRGTAVVAYEVDGRPVEAKLRVWLLPLEEGQQVAILSRPDRPEVVQLDNFWQRYAAPVGMVLFAGAVIGWEVLKRLRKLGVEPNSARTGRT